MKEKMEKTEEENTEEKAVLKGVKAETEVGVKMEETGLSVKKIVQDGKDLPARKEMKEDFLLRM